MIVLNKLVRDALLAKLLALIGFEKKAAVVAMDFRFDDQDPVQPRSANRDAQRRRSSRAWRSEASGTRTWLISSRERIVTDWSASVSKSMVTP